MTFPPQKISSARALIISTRQSLEKLLGVECEIEVKHTDTEDTYVLGILQMVEMETCVSIEEIKSGYKTGNRKIKRAKIMSTALVKKYCPEYVLKKIAFKLGYEDAVQLGNAVRKHADLLVDDDSYRKAYMRIKEGLDTIPRNKYVLNYLRE